MEPDSPAAVILLAFCFLTGCASLTGPDVEKSFRECLAYGGSATYIVTTDSKRVDCKR